MKKQKKSVIGPIFLNPEDDAKRPSRLPKLELNPDVIFNMIKLKSEKDTKGSNIQKLKESDNENFNETSEENVAKSPRGKFFSDLSDENENVKKWSNLSKIESHEKMEESKPEKSAKPGEKILKELEKENVPTLTIDKFKKPYFLSKNGVETKSTNNSPIPTKSESIEDSSSAEEDDRSFQPFPTGNVFIKITPMNGNHCSRFLEMTPEEFSKILPRLPDGT